MAYVYILRCRDGSLYTGAAKDLERRVEAHRTGRGARYTRGRRPVTLVFARRLDGYSAALREEARIKRLSRREKLDLIDAVRSPQRRRKTTATRSVSP